MLQARSTAVLACLTTFLTVLTLTSCSRSIPSEDEDSPVIRTTTGSVRGEHTTEGRQFLGIPYAADPVGSRRWQPPRPHPRWKDIRMATSFGPRCLQGTDPKRPTYTENCLNLNVYTPPKPRQLPVLVWIHGGGNIEGDARDIVADRFAAEGKAVVVTVNYRLGAAGFLTLPGGERNFGLLDQQSALRWVRANVARFGGDPAKVTIAGESSGGRSVCSHLASPTARGLFRGAISQSASYRDCDAIPPKNAEATGRAFAKALRCKSADAEAALDCLRSKKPREILTAQSDREWGPVVGDRLLPQQPAKAFRAGQQTRVPVLSGTTKTEGRYFDYKDYDGKGKPLTAKQYPRTMSDFFGKAIVKKVLARYPLADYPNPTLAHAAARGDRDYSCPTGRINRQLAQSAPVYQYELADLTGPPPEELRKENTDYDFGSTHTSDLQYLFRHHGHEAPFSAQQRQLSRQMIQYWSSFVRNGAPRAPGLPDMADQRVRPGAVTVLQTESAGGPRSIANFAAAHQCGLWDTDAARAATP